MIYKMNSRKKDRLVGVLQKTTSFSQRSSIFYVFIFALVVIGCKPLSKVGNNTLVTPLTKDDFQQLNGTFSDISDTIIGSVTHHPYDGWSDEQRITILNQLFYTIPEIAWRDENGKFINAHEKWIEIKFKSKKQAVVSMYHNDKFIFSKKIRGKFKNGYFYLRPKVYVIPIFPIVFGYHFERTRIGLTTNRNLIIDHTINMSGFAVLAGSSEKGATSSIYKRKSLFP